MNPEVRGRKPEGGRRAGMLRLDVVVAVLLFAAPAVWAATTSGSNPYQGIVDRNVFGLRPPPPPEVTKPPPPPPSKIILTGITTILGNKRALLQVPVPGKPPESYMLTEGQGSGDIQVLAIDEKNAIVKVKNGGMVETLDFTNNGAKPQPTAVAAAAPNPAIHAFPTPGAPPPLRTIPTRPMRIPTVPSNAGQTQASPQSGMPGSAGYEAPNPTTAMAQVQGITPEEQTIMIEAQRERLLQEGKSDQAAMFPPTQLTPMVTGDGNQNGPQQPIAPQ